MVEDLIRKYLGNDIRVYFMKDGLYLMLVVGLFIDPAVRGYGTARLDPPPSGCTP